MATYDQMYAFLVKIRNVLATPSLDNMKYILANQEPLRQIRKLLDRLNQSAHVGVWECDEAQKRTEEVARKFQQAWDLVDVKADALATQSRYVNTISQELGHVYRTRTSPPNKSWEMICVSLAFELKEAVITRQEMRWDLEDTEKSAEQWEARYILVVHRWQKTYQDTMHLREAFVKMHTEYLAVHSLGGTFMRRMQGVREWVDGDFESERVRRINQALARERE